MRLRSLIAAAGVGASAGVALAVLLTVVPGRLSAQIPSSSSQPSPAQMQQLLNSRPDLAAQLRTRLENSGLTPEQIRSRLESAGYPDSLLDNYLGASGSPDDTITPSAQVLNAVAQLGLLDSTAVDSAANTAALDSLVLRRQRGRLADTVDTSAAAYLDSLLLQRALRRVRPPPDVFAFDSSADTAFSVDSLRAVRARIRSLIADTTVSFSAKQRLLRQLAPPDSTLRVFGYDLFRRGTSGFQPNLAGPVDANYRIAPGDQLVLIITGEVEMSRALIVTRNGFMVVPQAGEINVANLTLGQLEDVLYDRLGRVYSGLKRGPNAKTHFSINVARLHTNQIFVVGSVTRPGSYQISSAGTVLTALYAAMGPDALGSLRHVDVRRAGVLVDSLDVYDYLLHGDGSHDVRLQTGDVVFVPVHGAQVKVAGDVIRPGIYELKPTESLRDVIRDAGGFAPTAAQHRVQVTRIVSPDQRSAAGGRDRVVIDIAAPSFDGASVDPALPMAAGDSVYVFRVADRVRDRIMVEGDVWAPGAQGLPHGTRLSDALKLAGGLKPDAYLGELLIARLRPDSTREQLRTRLTPDGAPTDDIILQEDDDIRVFALREMRPRQYVAITGAVRRGGRFAYHEGMTIRDLVLLANGVSDGAYLQEAEIARMPENRAAGVTAVTIRVPLDSSYVVGPGPRPTASSDPPDPVLRPYDNVLILREPDWTLPRTVAIAGEVVYPGRYALRTRSEHVRDLIARAGGLTAQANQNAISLSRTSNRGGRVAVDIQRALDNAKNRANIPLQGGDSIFIAPYTGVVRVSGEVNAPVSVTYQPGKDLYWYIDAAGGPGARADLKRAYVTQPGGRSEVVRRHFLLPSVVPVPVPGAVVVVPQRELRPREPDNTIQYLGIAVQALAGLATLIYLTRH